MIHHPRRRALLTAAPALITVPLLLGACTQAADNGEPPASGEEPLRVVTSFTILENMAEEIGGDLIEVHNLVPTGTDPHEYEPLPEDTKAVGDADLLIMNGLNLEGGDAGWFARLTESVGTDPDTVIIASHEVEPMMIGEGTAESEINPHAFIDPTVGIMMAEAIRDGLIAHDPEHEAEYTERANVYLDELEKIEAEYREGLDAIPEDQRVLVTSERAFQYLADRYDLTEYYIWEIDTEENGSAEQLTRLISELKEVEVPYLIIESNVDTRPMETISEETGIPIFEDPIYSDEIGDAEHPEANTYAKYLEYNLRVLTAALG